MEIKERKRWEREERSHMTSQVATGGYQARKEGKGCSTCLQDTICTNRRVKAHTTTFPERYYFPGGESTEFCHTERERGKKDFYKSHAVGTCPHVAKLEAVKIWMKDEIKPSFCHFLDLCTLFSNMLVIIPFF